LAEVVKVSVDLRGDKAFERISLLIHIRKETLDVPVLGLTRGRRPPSSLALYLVEILKPRIIAAGRGTWIGRSQAAKVLQKAASHGVKRFLRPARSGSPSLGNAPRSPRSGDGLDVGSIEAVVLRPPLDLLGYT